VPAAQVAVGRHQLARDGKQQPQREIGNIVGENVRCVGEDHAALTQRSQVDAVVTHSEHRHDFNRRQFCQQFARDLGFAASHERAHSRG
jgi:hypothetical protein